MNQGSFAEFLLYIQNFIFIVPFLFFSVVLLHICVLLIYCFVFTLFELYINWILQCFIFLYLAFSHSKLLHSWDLFMMLHVAIIHFYGCVVTIMDVLFIYSIVDGCLGCLQFLDVKISAAENILVHISRCSGDISRIGIGGHNYAYLELHLIILIVFQSRYASLYSYY